MIGRIKKWTKRPFSVTEKYTRSSRRVYRGFQDPITSQFKDIRGRSFWNETPYEKNLLFTAVITWQCTLRCDHCFEEAGPEKDTFLDASRLDEVVEESIDIFQEHVEPRTIEITGGDPFLHPDLPQIIEAFSKRKDSLGYDTLDVETNGWWATDDKTTRDYVRMLKYAGATLLSMTVDYYHCKQGVFDIYEHIDRISNIARQQELGFRSINVGLCISDDEEIKREEEEHKDCCLGWIPEVTPIGRGRLLPEKYWEGLHSCNLDGCRLIPPTLVSEVHGNYVHTAELTIQADGNVYPCNSGKEFEHLTLSLGNIYEDSLPEIWESQDNPLVNMIREKGLRALSKKAGLSFLKHWDMYYKFTPCGLCHELLREHGERISNQL